MRYIETVLRVASNQGRLVMISATSPISGLFQVTGAVIALRGAKVRVALVDSKRFERLVDDLGEAQRLTIPLASIKRVNILWTLGYVETSIQDNHNDGGGDVAILYPMLEATLAKPRISTLDKLSLETCFDNLDGRIVETRLSVKHGDGSIPVISREKLYDVKTQAFIDADWVIHYEQPLTTHFKHVPVTPDIAAFKTFAIDQEALDEIPRLLMMNMAIKRTDASRLRTWANDAGNRPRKAYLNRLSTKNLGRKDYVVPFIDAHLDMREQRAVFTALKHPVTRIDATINKTSFFTHLCRAAVLNDCSVLVIDPDRLCQDASNSPGVLSLLSHQESVDALSRLKTIKATENNVSVPIANDYDALFEAIDDADRAEMMLQLVLERLNASKAANHFQGIVNYGSLYESLARSIKPVSLKLFDKAIESTHVREAQVLQTLHKRRERMHGSSYKRITDVMHIDAAKVRLRAFRKLLKSPFHLHQLKHLFPVMLVKDTKALAYLKHAFDLVVIMRPTMSAVIDFHYADKVAVFDTDAPQNTPYFTKADPHVLTLYGGNVFDVFEANDNDEIKRVPMQNTYDGLVRLAHVAAPDEKGHVSRVEAELVAKRAKVLEDYRVYAPFVAQRKALRALHDGPVQGLYTPPLQPALIATSIHKNTSRDTYNWLKNHPFITPSFTKTIWPIEWFVDIDALVALSNTKDALFAIATKAFDAHTRGFDLLNEVLDDMQCADEVLFGRENAMITLFKQNRIIAKIYFIAAYHGNIKRHKHESIHNHYITGKLRALVLNIIHVERKSTRLRVKRTRDAYA